MINYLNLVIQVILIATLSIAALLLVRLRNSVNKEKRIVKFSLDSINDRPTSFFDRIDEILNIVTKRLSKILKKSTVMRNYSNQFEKYIDQTAMIRNQKMDYVSRKIIFAFIAVIITIISDVLQTQIIEPFQLLVASLIGFFVLDVFLSMEYSRKQKALEADLLKAVTIMNNAFKSGRSIMQAVELVSTELTGAISDEFRKMFIDLSYGLELELVFARFSKRVNLEEVKYMASSLVILNKTGGNVVKVFSSIEKGFFDRKKLKDELKSTTALSDAVFKLLVAIPFFIFAVIYLFNPNYFMPLFLTVIGKVLLVLILLIYTLYIIIVRKIVTVKE